MKSKHHLFLKMTALQSVVGAVGRKTVDFRGGGSGVTIIVIEYCNLGTRFLKIIRKPNLTAEKVRGERKCEERGELKRMRRKEERKEKARRKEKREEKE